MHKENHGVLQNQTLPLVPFFIRWQMGEHVIYYFLINKIYIRNWEVKKKAQDQILAALSFKSLIKKKILYRETPHRLAKHIKFIR